MSYKKRDYFKFEHCLNLEWQDNLLLIFNHEFYVNSFCHKINLSDKLIQTSYWNIWKSNFCCLIDIYDIILIVKGDVEYVL